MIRTTPAPASATLAVYVDEPENATRPSGSTPQWSSGLNPGRSSVGNGP